MFFKLIKKIWRISILLIGLILLIQFVGMLFSIGNNEFNLKEFLIVFLKMFAALAWFFSTKENTEISKRS
ncbi:hypothetical protein [Clostridium gasigenes]|uniref:hypothetical protein n=1 Tax=Clostridium gasigenes TaxID=94869 RepID=UPI001C0E0399|nr:hypothetical protein [Clostridium gasigenes]MBU3105680.1 hypothetical protein [Clostridium gasigenes]